MTNHINDISIPYNLRQNHSYVKNFVGNVYAHTIALCMLMVLRSIEPKRIGNYEMLTGNHVPNNISAILHKLINALKTETKLYIPNII